MEKTIDDFLQSQEKPAFSGYDEDMYEKLPRFFRRLLKRYSRKQDKDNALFSALVLLSGILPNYYHENGDERIYCNLYGFVVAPFSAGKGIIKDIKRLIQPIHDAKVARSDKMFRDFMNGKKDKAKVKDSDAEEGEEGAENSEGGIPPRLMLFFPSDNTKTNLIITLKENNGRGIIFDTEAMTLSFANKSEHGQFIDFLLKAFHNEPIEVSRRGDKLYISLPFTFLSVLLSGTEDSIMRLMGNLVNGLISRFEFQQAQYQAYKPRYGGNYESKMKWFTDMSHEFSALYEHLENKSTEIDFLLTREQQKRLDGHFTQLDANWAESNSEDSRGFIFRAANKLIRYAMILSIIRIQFDIKQMHEMPDTITCTDDDFECAMSITMTSLANTVAIYEKLKGGNKPTVINSKTEKGVKKVEQRMKIIELARTGLSQTDIVRIVYGEVTPAGKTAVSRIFKDEGLTDK